jgi:hypothetical protein
MEAWVRDRKDEDATRLQHLCQARKKRGDFRHIHEGHRTDSLVESGDAQGQKGIRLGRIKYMVLYGSVVGGTLPSTLDELRAVIECDNARPELSHPPGEATRTTGNVQNDVTTGDGKKPFGGRFNQ